MTFDRRALVGAVAAAAVVVVGSVHWSVRAQDRQPPSAPRSAQAAQAGPAPEAPAQVPARRAAVSVQEALLLPCDIPFDRPTTLKQVATFLEHLLGAQVVLDRGALERQERLPSDTVELELKGVRLKTALKVLLDQVDLTYKVIPEDNLLVITDSRESDEPYQQILDELESLHRDVHTIQDKLDEVLGEEEAGIMEGAEVLKIGRRRAARGL